MQLEPEIQALLKEAGLGNDAVWQHKQSKQWIVYHWALEFAAATKGIRFEPPVVVTSDPANKLAVICVTGHLGDHTEWSFGEAAPYNTTQTYPFAMAEKRAKDRVILKLLNLHGRLYSEEEADTFKSNGRATDPTGTADQTPAASHPDGAPVPSDGTAPPRNGKLTKDPDWIGPMGKTDLSKVLREFSRMLGDGVHIIEELDNLLDEYGPALDQCKKDMPGWWDGSGSPPMPKEYVPLKERIEAKRRFLKSTAKQEPLSTLMAG